jgi:myo-inositol catabolism protein IolC
MLSEACRASEPQLMLELVEGPSASGAGDQSGAEDWHRRADPSVTVDSIRRLQDAGVEPSVWVVEPPEDARAAATIAGQAHVDDRVGVSVLFAVGNDPSTARSGADVDAWLRDTVRLAARTVGVTGLLIGPAFYFRQLALFNSEQMSRTDAVTGIASQFRALCDEFSAARRTSDVL